MSPTLTVPAATASTTETEQLRRRLAQSIRRAAQHGLQITDAESLTQAWADVLADESALITVRADTALLEATQATEAASNPTDPRERWPELGPLVHRHAERLAALADDVLGRYAADRAALREAGLPSSAVVLGVETTPGDSHRGGQRVCLVHTEEGSIVYKPRSLAVDDAVHRAAAVVNGRLPDAERITVPAVLDRGHYGWQEFIEATAVDTPDGLARHYRSLGALTAFFAAVGGHDLHYDNVIFSRGRVVPIDLEAALGNLRTVRRLEGPGLTGALKRLIHSAGASTLLLPPLIRSARFDIDLSPVSDGRAQESGMMRSLRLESRDAAASEAQLVGAVLVKPTPHGDVDAPDGERHPRTFVAQFRAGFARAADAVLETRGELIGLFRSLGHVPNRCIIRPTSTYAAFLDTSHHPDYLSSREARVALFRAMGPPPGAPAPIGALALDEEVRQLLDGDIPFFTDADLAALAVRASAEDAAAGVEDFRIAPVEALELFDPTPRAAIDHIHAGAFAGQDEDVWGTREEPDVETPFTPDPGPGFGPALVELAEQALALVVHDPDSGEAGMMLQSVGPDHRVRVSPLDPTWYDGAGVVEILDAAAAETSDPRFRAALTGLLRTVLRTPVSLEGAQVSGWIDAFSRLRLAPMMRRVCPEQEVDAWVRQGLEAAGRRVAEDTEHSLQTDLVTGLAGALEVCGLLHRAGWAAEAGPLGHELAGRIQDVLDSGEKDGIRGVAHGPLGMAAALADWSALQGQTTPERMRRWASGRGLEECLALGSADPRDRRSWCSGTSGIVQAWTRITAHGGPITTADREPILREAEAFLAGLEHRPGEKVDVSLCHGLAGALEAWIETARTLQDEVLLARLQDEVRRLRHRWSAGELLPGGGARHARAGLTRMLSLSGALIALRSMDSG